MRVRRFIDRHAVDEGRQVGAVVQIISTEQVLIGLALAAVRGDVEPGTVSSSWPGRYAGVSANSSFTTTPSLALVAMPISRSRSAVTVISCNWSTVRRSRRRPAVTAETRCDAERASDEGTCEWSAQRIRIASFIQYAAFRIVQRAPLDLQELVGRFALLRIQISFRRAKPAMFSAARNASA